MDELEWARVLDETKAEKNRAVIRASNAEDIIRQLRARVAELAAVVQAARDMHEHMVAAHPQQACASCALRLKGLSEALGALDSK